MRPHYFWSVTHHCLLKTWRRRRLECQLRKLEAYEDDKRLHFDGESDFPRFLDSVLQRTDQISQMKVDEEIVEQHIVVVDQTVRLLRIPRYTPRQQFEYQRL